MVRILSVFLVALSCVGCGLYPSEPEGLAGEALAVCESDPVGCAERGRDFVCLAASALPDGKFADAARVACAVSADVLECADRLQVAIDAHR